MSAIGTALLLSLLTAVPDADRIELIGATIVASPAIAGEAERTAVRLMAEEAERRTGVRWPLGMRYNHLDPAAEYTIRTTGFGTCLLSIDGERVLLTVDNGGSASSRSSTCRSTCSRTGRST